MSSRKYYFLDYLDRKKRSAEHANKKKQREGLEKSVKLANNLKDKKITPADIFESLKSKVNPEDITAISPLGGNREFVVSFEQQVTANRMIGESLIIKKEKFYILDANDTNQIFKVKAVVKIHWLPPGQDWEEIEEHFAKVKSLKITEKSREKYREDALKHIRNGVLALKVEYELSEHDEVVKEILGIRQFDSGLARVQISGHPPICSHCGGFHFERECKSARKNSYGAKASIVAGKTDNELVVEEEDIADISPPLEQKQFESTIANIPDKDPDMSSSTFNVKDQGGALTVPAQADGSSKKKQLQKTSSFTKLLQATAETVSSSLNFNFLNKSGVSPEMKKPRGEVNEKNSELAQKFRKQQKQLAERGIDSELELGMNDTQIEKLCGNHDTTKFDDLPSSENI